MVLAQSIITIVVALLLGVKFSSGFPGILLILVTVSFFELALSGIFLFVGMRSRKTETISAIGSAVFFPIIFISSAMFPVSFFPSWAQTISEYNPVSYAADVTRQTCTGRALLEYGCVRVFGDRIHRDCFFCCDAVPVQKSNQLIIPLLADS